jgi:agmatine deiminase
VIKPYLPAEWATQSGVLLTWPNSTNVWEPSLGAIDDVFVQIAKTIARFEKVIISCCSNEHLQHVQQQLTPKSANIFLYVVPSHDVWARDHGPITVYENNQPKLLDFTFNGWGKKYPFEEDNKITEKLYQQDAFGQTLLQQIPFVIEGGSIECDGKGTILTTSRCLLSPMRNPQDDREDITRKLQSWLGIERVLWLDHGYIAGDDTDGHIDTLARFINPETICYVKCDDPSDEHYESLQKMAQQLQTFSTKAGKPYRLVPLPWPQAKFNADGKRLPATYANFLIINQAVLLPTYADPADAIAINCLQECFPDHEIISIACQHLINQLGSLHCVTMQLPEGVV